MMQYKMKMLLKFVWPCNMLKWRWNYHEENDEVVVMREMDKEVVVVRKRLIKPLCWEENLVGE